MKNGETLLFDMLMLLTVIVLFQTFDRFPTSIFFPSFVIQVNLWIKSYIFFSFIFIFLSKMKSCYYLHIHNWYSIFYTVDLLRRLWLIGSYSQYVIACEVDIITQYLQQILGYHVEFKVSHFKPLVSAVFIQGGVFFCRLFKKYIINNYWIWFLHDIMNHYTFGFGT